MTGRLEVYCGSMFAEKSTSLIRQGKRHLMGGRSVAFVKPYIDNRYGEDVVATHDGVKHFADSIKYDAFTGNMEDFTSRKHVNEAQVVCIDEVQFFPKLVIKLIEKLLYEGKTVYVAGLDMDKDGRPFETTMALMGIAEEVHKVQAVCRDCGEDAWVTIQEKETERIHVGNDGYKPCCRACSYKYLGKPVPKWN
ncbi:thymidine kinase [Peribacillus muralis]|uniref:thymidine kinase n=1 Tax=Peribacillus muralis TaxID=264697 RepID=UPI0036700F45